MPSLSISDDAFSRFPTLRIVTLDVYDLPQMVDRSRITPSPDCLSHLKSRPVADLPEVNDWRKAYQAMGLKASKFQSSIEALVRRAIRPNEAWKTGIAAVDLYNAISIQYIAPLGAYDLDKLGSRVINVRPLNIENDQFNAIGGGKSFLLDQNIIGYACDEQVICWALNHRDSVDFQLADATSRAAFISEAISDIQYQASKSAIVSLMNAAAAAGVDYGIPMLHDAESPTGRPYS